MDKDNTNLWVIPETDLATCESVKEYIHFCLGQSFQLMASPPTCLISLHQGDTTWVINECPITLLDENYMYVLLLGVVFLSYSTRVHLYTIWQRETYFQFMCATLHLTINARYNEIYLQYVYYNLLAHILFFTSSYVLVSVHYSPQIASLYVQWVVHRFYVQITGPALHPVPGPVPHDVSGPAP